jgi:hypothetical protein
VRFDRLGNVAWQKCLGGGPNDGFDSRPSACLTDGGGYAILGDAAEFSWAVSSDVAGIHGAEPDIWLVKLEADI